MIRGTELWLKIKKMTNNPLTNLLPFNGLECDTISKKKRGFNKSCKNVGNDVFQMDFFLKIKISFI